ncbi:MAG: hypothetical protein H7841_09000 [Magnetospirillum sp. WYHS-4]
MLFKASGNGDILRLGFAALLLGVLFLVLPGRAEAHDHGNHGHGAAMADEQAMPAASPKGDLDGHCGGQGDGCCCVTAYCHAPLLTERAAVALPIPLALVLPLPTEAGLRALADEGPPPRPPRA